MNDNIEISPVKKQGGIQKGGSASSAKSVKLDKQCKVISKKLSKEFPGYSEGHNKRKPIFEGIGSGCMPDGGLWFDLNSLQKKIRLAFEAKHQGNHGNAQERHAKNYIIAKAHRGETFRYVTVMTGEGAVPGGVLDTYAKTMLNCENPEGSREINKIHDDGLSFILSPDGFTDEEIEELLRKALS
jgi:hypothetical protein